MAQMHVGLARTPVKGEAPVCVSVCSCKEGMADQPPRRSGPQVWVKDICVVGCSNTDGVVEGDAR